MDRSGLYSDLLFYTFITSFFFLSFVFLPGCTNQEESLGPDDSNPAVTPVHGGTYRAPLRSNPPTLDPAYVQDKYGVTVVKQIFKGIVQFDAYLTILPALAETWQIREEGKVYQFTIREDAKFHTLDPVTSDDVVFTIKRLLRAEPAPAVLPHLMKIIGAVDYRNKRSENLPGIIVVNPKTFKVLLKESHVPFLTALGMYQAAIVPKDEVLRLGERFGKQPVGAGPFRFVSWENEKSIQLQRFDSYYDKAAYLDEIQYKIYPGGQDPIVLSDFEKGHLEEMAVYEDRRQKLADIKGLQWFKRPSLSLFFYGMNLNHPHLSDPNVRKALSIAIDRQLFVQSVYKGRFEIARTILPPGMPGYTPSNKIEDSDPDLSQQILKDMLKQKAAGLPELEIVSAIHTPRVEQEMDMIKGFWKVLGITANIKYITDWKQFEAYLKTDSVQIYRYAWFADMPDPDSFLYSLFASESPTNFMNFKNKEIDKSLLAARGIVDPVQRAKMYQRIEAEIIKAAPLIPLFYMNVDRVYQPYVKSVKVSALGAHTMPLNQIWLDIESKHD